MDEVEDKVDFNLDSSGEDPVESRNFDAFKLKCIESLKIEDQDQIKMFLNNYLSGEDMKSGMENDLLSQIPHYAIFATMFEAYPCGLIISNYECFYSFDRNLFQSDLILPMSIIMCVILVEDLYLGGVKDSDGNSILHLAVIHNQLKIVEILCQNELTRINFQNNDAQQTPLHLFHSEKNNKFIKCDPPDHNSLEVLLSSKSGMANANIVNAQDTHGNTSLHLAVKKKCAYCIERLLRCGAEFNMKSGDSQNCFVTPAIFNEYPWAGDMLGSRLDKAVSYEKLSVAGLEKNPGESRQFRVLMDFGQIVTKFHNQDVDEAPRREMEFLETFLSTNSVVRKKIFSHPLVSSFVFFKSERVRWIFLLSLILHIALATVYTIYTLTVYLKNCPYNAMNSQGSSNATSTVRLACSGICDRGFGSVGFSACLLIVTGVLGILEIMKFLQNMVLYLKTWTNFFQGAMIVCMWLTVWPVKWTPNNCLYSWQYSASAYGIFHVWSTLMINVGRFPKLGIYVEMFGKVLLNFGYLMLAYVFLMIGFSISFCVIFPDYPPFETIPRAVLKVITMMSGEVDYRDFFYGDHKARETVDIIFTKESTDLIHPITAHLLYGAFVILVTIVLTNLLIGLAVDDIKALQQNAEFTKTTRQIANIAYLESVIFWTLIPNWKFVEMLRKSIFLGRLETTTNERKASFAEVLIDCMVNNVICKTVFRDTNNAVPSKSDRTSLSSNKPLSMYCFGVSQGDCKSPRCFPEDILLQSVELIKTRDRQDYNKPENIVKLSSNRHCPSCHSELLNS